MTTLLVLGATGQIGHFLVPMLVTEHRVLAVSRQASASGVADAPIARASSLPGIDWIHGDLDRALPPLEEVDAIFSLGPLDRFAAWFARERPRTRAVIALSSMSALTKRDSPDAGERALAWRLCDSERLLIDAATLRGMPCTVLRPTLVYGAGLDRSLTPLARRARKLRVFPLLPGATGLRQPVHAADVAQACFAAWQRPGNGPRTLELGGGERLAYAQMLARVRAGLGFFTLPVPLPLAPLVHLAPRGYAGVFARLREDLVADNTALIHELGVRPRAFAPGAAAWRVPQSRFSPRIDAAGRR